MESLPVSLLSCSKIFNRKLQQGYFVVIQYVRLMEYLNSNGVRYCPLRSSGRVTRKGLVNKLIDQFKPLFLQSGGFHPPFINSCDSSHLRSLGCYLFSVCKSAQSGAVITSVLCVSNPHFSVHSLTPQAIWQLVKQHNRARKMSFKELMFKICAVHTRLRF